MLLSSVRSALLFLSQHSHKNPKSSHLPQNHPTDTPPIQTDFMTDLILILSFACNSMEYFSENGGSFPGHMTVVEPGFPVEGAWTRYRGCGPPTQVLFTENVCKNERIGSHRGGMHQAHPLDLPMHDTVKICFLA